MRIDSDACPVHAALHGRHAARIMPRWHNRCFLNLMKSSVLLASLVLALNSSATTYYIDYSAGSDSSSGNSKSSPWQRHPFMKGFAGSYSHSAGDRFIFKGGVTWPNACFNIS